MAEKESLDIVTCTAALISFSIYKLKKCVPCLQYFCSLSVSLPCFDAEQPETASTPTSGLI